MGKIKKNNKNSKEILENDSNHNPKLISDKVKKGKSKQKKALILPEQQDEIRSEIKKAGKNKSKINKAKSDGNAETTEEVITQHEVLKEHATRITPGKSMQTEALILPEAEQDEISPEIRKNKSRKAKKSHGKVEISKAVIITQETPNKDATQVTAGRNVPEKSIRHDSKPENTVFIGNIPPNTKKKQLQVLFGQFGKVISVRIRTNDGKKLFKHETRKKADTLNAYVVFDNIESTRKAMNLTGTEFKGKHIRVTAIKDFTDQVEPKRILFVGNLKYSATDEKLHDIFVTCGEIEYVRTLRNNKGCSGVAYVCFKKPESITIALELNNTMLDERPIRVQRYMKNKIGANVKSKPVPATRLIGSARRIMEKNKQKDTKGQKPGQKFNMKNDTKATKKKKADYIGIKTASKKKLKNKKKSPHLQILASKITPK